VKLFADIATRSIHLRLSQRRGTMNIRYRVDLSEAERSELEALLRGGRHAARTLKRAQILLAADAGLPDETIAQSLRVGGSTVYRTRRRFVEGNLDKALTEEPRPGAKRKLTGHEEALLVATACSRPPEGRARWTIDLLAGEMVRLTDHGSLSGETVRRRLAENKLKPWREKMWCVPKIDGEYVARMEDVLDLYAAPPDAPGGLPRREPRSADRRGTRAHSGIARADRARRLRVPPQRHGQPVRGRGCAPAVAQGERDRAAHGAGLCRASARARRRGLP
jgi:transposase